MILTSSCVCQKDVAEKINLGFFKWWHFYFSADQHFQLWAIHVHTEDFTSSCAGEPHYDGSWCPDAARTAHGRSSPAINMDGTKSGIVSKVSLGEEARREVWQEFSEARGYTGGLCISAFQVCVKPSCRPEGTFLPALQLVKHTEKWPQPPQCLFWGSTSSIEAFQATNSLRYYSCMISRARDLYKLDMSWKIWIMCCMVQQRVIYRPLLCNKTIVCWADIYGIILYVLIALFENI